MKKEIIIAAIIIAVAILGYGYMNYSIKQQAMNLEEQNRKNLTKSYSQCLDKQEKRYKDQWNNECKRAGEGDSCLLPGNISNPLNQFLENDRATCYKLFPVK